MSSVVDVRSVGDGDEAGARLSVLERAAVTAVVNTVIMRCEMEGAGERLRAQLRARRRKLMQSPASEGFDSVAICDAVMEVAWPKRVQKAVVLRAFADKGFPNCHGCIDCTHVYIDKPANAPPEDYFDRKRRFSIVAQVVVDLDLRVLDVFVGYPGSFHDVMVIHLSSLWSRAAVGELFTGPPVLLPFQVQTNGYLLGDNGYPPSEWIVVPYGGIAQYPFEIRFDNKQKTARGAVERAFGRLKGMWRLFLRSHKTNMETLPQQFVAVCILHNILIDVGIPFDENLLWEVDANGVHRRVDLGIQRPPGPCAWKLLRGKR
ncbi:hypothetical protein CBR_g21161 [Chara braunii]|uniref:DDE Tnp4 domain-containing protein n=1 Tax=Chara braunii TaxID=69332 RepID=A0A388L0T9_CHABU|nr:hypothetical protein CBR_g21161 [Chara braunii]|eukprot:GBG75919.1 hypothetical protein CBR_g21161 [Chara braunii]